MIHFILVIILMKETRKDNQREQQDWEDAHKHITEIYPVPALTKCVQQTMAMWMKQIGILIGGLFQQDQINGSNGKRSELTMKATTIVNTLIVLVDEAYISLYTITR